MSEKLRAEEEQGHGRLRALFGAHWAAGLLLLVGVATYANGLHGPFIFDDYSWIDKNSSIRRLWPLYHLLQSPPNNPLQGRPVISLTIAANWALGERNVTGYHVVNIAVHLLAALTLLGIVRRTLRLKPLGERFDRHANGLAFACALLWMLHPIQTECVNYITQRTESIMGLFYFLTLYCAIRASDSVHRNRWTIAAIIASALGMASKEVMVTAPFMVFLYDMVFRHEPVSQMLRRRRLLYAGLAATWGLLATLMILFPRETTVGFSVGVSPWEYLKCQSLVVYDYLGRILWPQVLVLDYGYARHYFLKEVIGAALLLLALLSLTVWALVKRPPLGYLGAWFFVTLAPSSSFVPVLTEVGAERRLYVPLAGAVVLFVIGIYVLVGRIAAAAAKGRGRDAPLQRRHRLVALALLVVVAAAYCLRTVARNAEYGDLVALMASAVNARPGNYRALSNLGYVLCRQGRVEESMPYFARALELNPDGARENFYVGMTNYFVGNYDVAEFYLLRGVALDPNHSLTKKFLALTREARAEGVDGNEKPTATQFGELKRAGDYYMWRGQFDRAAESYRRALRLQPDSFAVHHNLGVVLVNLREFEESAEQFKRAIAIRPGEIQPYLALGRLYAEQQQFARAEEMFR